MSKPGGGGGAGGLARPAITLETSKFQAAERREPGRISATQAGAQLKRGGRGDDLRPGGGHAEEDGEQTDVRGQVAAHRWWWWWWGGRGGRRRGASAGRIPARCSSTGHLTGGGPLTGGGHAPAPFKAPSRLTPEPKRDFLNVGGGGGWGGESPKVIHSVPACPCWCCGPGLEANPADVKGLKESRRAQGQTQV